MVEAESGRGRRVAARALDRTARNHGRVTATLEDLLELTRAVHRDQRRRGTGAPREPGVTRAH